MTGRVGRDLRPDDVRIVAAREMNLRGNAVINVIDPTKSYQPTFPNASATCVIARRSIDARNDVVYRYRIEGYNHRFESYVPYEVAPYRDVSEAEPVIIVGAGPAGLSAAVTLRRRGWAVTVFERRANIGGLLRYGIPCFKLDKALVDRRRAILEAEGIRFETGVEVGTDVSAAWLARRFDAVVLAIGTPAARDLPIPGRDLEGVHFALELLEGQNRFLTGEIPAPPIDAKGKRVLVIGGGDTGSDCVGTAVRQGAASVAQIEIMPKPPAERDPSTPWPLWPYMLRTSSSHLEGCERRWNLSSVRFVGDGGRVAGVEVETVEWEFSPEGRPLKFHPVPGTRETIPADLVLLAMGFTGVPKDHPIVVQLGLAQTPRTALVADPARNVYCVGDCASGASLVVRALASGKTLPL